ERIFQLVYFEIEAVDSDVRGSEPIFVGNDCVGVPTSGGYGHRVQKRLGFGYVDPTNSEPGTELAVDLLGVRCRATVLRDPVYDPDNERLRA
ncbi:MAG: aminomethyltransferase, partial [Proteobacteria bacterium]|nr:aminomethyltransferase [Pseudomonadota bacterium]